MALKDIDLSWAGEERTTAYTQEVQFTYKGEEYEVTLMWNGEDGMDICYGDLPEELEDQAREVASHLEALALTI
jgi:hypothetical protein